MVLNDVAEGKEINNKQNNPRMVSCGAPWVTVDMSE